MMEIENEKRLWDGENSFKGSRMHQRQRIPQVFFYFLFPGNCTYYGNIKHGQMNIVRHQWTDVGGCIVVRKAQLASKCHFSRRE